MTEKNKMLPMVCTVCGKTFYAEYPKHPKYCSEECRNSKIIKNEHVGEKFGKLTIVSDFQKSGRRYAECKCECGGSKTTGLFLISIIIAERSGRMTLWFFSNKWELDLRCVIIMS